MGSIFAHNTLRFRGWRGAKNAKLCPFEDVQLFLTAFNLEDYILAIKVPIQFNSFWHLAYQFPLHQNLFNFSATIPRIQQLRALNTGKPAQKVNSWIRQSYLALIAYYIIIMISAPRIPPHFYRSSSWRKNALRKTIPPKFYFHLITSEIDWKLARTPHGRKRLLTRCVSRIQLNKQIVPGVEGRMGSVMKEKQPAGLRAS